MNRRYHTDEARNEGVGSQPGWTKHELMIAGDLSAKSFDTIRKSARVPGPTHGRLKHVFGPDKLIALIQKAESGRFTERGAPAARAWRALLSDAGVAMPITISRGRR